MGKRGTYHFCFFDTDESTDTVFESIDFSDDWEDPQFEWYLQSPNAGDSTRDAEEGLQKQ